MKAAVLITCAAAVGLVLLLDGEGENAESPAAVRIAPPVRPAAPARYRVPRAAIRVSSSRRLHAALASSARRSIVLAAGTYESRRPFLNPHGHAIYAARRGRAVLRAGLSLGGNSGRPGALVRGVVVDIDDGRRTVDGAAIAVWGTGRDVRILDTTLRGNSVTRAGISASQPAGLVVRRVVVRGFTDFGIFVDANELDRARLSDPFRIRDADVARVGRSDPGSSNGRAEACIWIGNTGSIRRARLRACAWTGLWTGTSTDRALVDGLDVDLAPTGVYIEHFTRDSTFRRLRIGRGVRIGLTAEWADPAWDRRPASIDNLIELSRFESWLAGVYLDEGSTRTTVRRSSFANQSWAAIGDYRGDGNAFGANDYAGVDAGVPSVRHDHISTAREG
ncbi:MAG TPA: hypothetical protein VNO82_13465 [Solirubrobacteraceae bacterium]|nr:hypothetical protein [Solirubrobacteraceae bacterium]